MTTTIVKVQLPIDMERAHKTHKAYADTKEHRLFIYDRKRIHVFQGRDDRLRKFMLDADNGVGYLKAFMKAHWNGDEWIIDYDAGFQPMQDW